MSRYALQGVTGNHTVSDAQMLDYFERRYNSVKDYQMMLYHPAHSEFGYFGDLRPHDDKENPDFDYQKYAEDISMMREGEDPFGPMFTPAQEAAAAEEAARHLN